MGIVRDTADKTKLIVSVSDPQKRAQWTANGFNSVVPNKAKRADAKLRTQPNTNPFAKKDFEIGPRLKTVALDTDEHIIWPGATREGYGVKKYQGKVIDAHRWVYEQVKGKPIPFGMYIDHKCRERRCVNPRHLEVVTSGENKRRAWQSKYFREGNHDKVTDKDVRKAYSLPPQVQNRFATLAVQAATAPTPAKKALKPLSDAAANKLFSDRAAMRRARIGKPKVSV